MIPLLFAQLCLTEFLLGGRDQSKIRIKSEVGTVKHVEALKFFFLLARILSIVFLNVKNLKTWPLPRTLCVLWGGGSSSNIYHYPAIGYSIMCVDRCWRMEQWLQMHFTPTRRVGICVR